MNLKPFLLPILLLTGSLQGFCQQAKKIAAGLQAEGFENIRVLLEDGKCYAGMENHVYRWDVRAIGKALDLLSGGAESPLEINLVIQLQGIPQVLIRVKSTDWQDFAKGNVPPEEFAGRIFITSQTDTAWGKIRGIKALNPNTGKIDLVVYPQLFFENTLKTQFYEAQWNIAPALEFSLWKGNRFTGQVIFPLHNGLGYEGNFTRPGYVTVSQDFRLPRQWFATLAAGNFSNNRYGADVTLRHPFPGGRWNLELNTGLTGFSHFLDNSWTHGPLNTFTGSASLGWFYSRFNLELRAGAARYIYRDYGFFASCTRHFGETSVGFYARAGRESKNGGFYFSVPLPFKKRIRPQLFRITLPEKYTLDYNAGTEFYYGQNYCPNIDLNPQNVYIFTDLLKNMLITYKNNNK